MVNVTKTKSFKRCEMKNKILLTITLLGIVGLSFACNNDGHSNEDTTYSLVGTKWELVGFFDIEKNKLIEPELSPNGFRCYRINFDTDSELSGRSSFNQCYGIYEADYSTLELEIHFWPSTAAGELPHGYSYIDAINEVKTFQFSDDSLKLYYNDKKNCLLFARRNSCE